MFTPKMLYLILTTSTVGLWLIYIFVCYPYKTALKEHKKIFLFLSACAVTISLSLVNPVYITDDDDKVEQYLLLFPSYQNLNNGELVYLHPQVGLSNAWVINNGKRNVIFETVVYGMLNQQMIVKNINAYTAENTRIIDFFFQPPPINIKIKKNTEVKGWLHR